MSAAGYSRSWPCGIGWETLWTVSFAKSKNTGSPTRTKAISFYHSIPAWRSKRSRRRAVSPNAHENRVLTPGLFGLPLTAERASIRTKSRRNGNRRLLAPPALSVRPRTRRLRTSPAISVRPRRGRVRRRMIFAPRSPLRQQRLRPNAHSSRFRTSTPHRSARGASAIELYYAARRVKACAVCQDIFEQDRQSCDENLQQPPRDMVTYGES
jgi:hypothetical protein